MKKFSLVASLVLASSICAQAQLLWKITGNGLKHPSYLFGTHHLTPISFLDSVPGLYPAFNACDAVVGEMMMNSIDAAEKIQKAAIMPNGLKINELLSKDEFTLVDKELKSVLKLGLNELSIMYPELIQSMYETELFKKLIGLKDEQLSDSYFQLVAVEKDKKVIALETIEQQIAFLFHHSSPARQAELLVQAIKHKDLTIADMKLIDKAYKTGKLNDLISLARKDGEFTDEEYSRIVDNRNLDWAKKLPEFMHQSSCFIAVGALHLAGKNGLIQQLQKAGYKIKAVEVTN